MLAAEIVYRDDFEYEALLPGAFASVVAYAIFGAVFGYSLAVLFPRRLRLPARAAGLVRRIGALAGGIGLLYSKSFYGVARLARPALPCAAPASDGGVWPRGLVALWLPEVFGTGYGWVQRASRPDLGHLPLYVVIASPSPAWRRRTSPLAAGARAACSGRGW